MALTAYCKKCDREVAPGEICPHCGTHLGKNAAHAAWCVERRPVADWMCWNAVMRILLPVGGGVLLLVLLLEAVTGGPGALERLFLSGLPETLLILLSAVGAVVLLALLLQGKDLMDYVVDSRGIHVTRYLPDPTPLRLLLRGKSPALLNGEAQEVLKLEERSLSWREVSRVQLWPEKCYVLFYAPAWWLRLAVRCTPFTWEDTLGFVREKLGKKKKLRLPDSLRVQAERKPAARRGGQRQAAVRMPPREPVPAEDGIPVAPHLPPLREKEIPEEEDPSPPWEENVPGQMEMDLAPFDASEKKDTT